MLLSNKTALITGASSGIGKAIASTFAKESCKLIITARRTDLINSLAEELKIKYSAEILPLTLDVRNRNDVENMFAKLPKEFADIDILVNNAGLARGFNTIQDGNIDDWEEMLDTNIKGLLYVSKSIIPIMLVKNKGYIINIGSLAGEAPYPMGNVYCGTKSFVKTISQAMKIDLNNYNIRVTNLSPGLTETEFANVRFHWDTEKAKKVYIGYEPLKAEDIADVALFCVTRPEHVNIQDILITPTAQATSTIVNKKIG